MDQVIVDASVGIKWFFQEHDSEKAILLLDRFQRGEIKMIVPEIFYSEVASSYWKKVRKKLASVSQAIESLDRIIGLSVTKYSDFELADVGLENALRFGISVYDGLYLALAEIYLAPLITADKVLYNACSRRFDFIELLENVHVKD
ncbi:MAG TPA: type II toxin-antitoxin system VapC family toxin [bacterium]|nr:type II toxin-antitoxin system VapC family toxin [bacterium]